MKLNHREMKIEKKTIKIILIFIKKTFNMNKII